MQNQTTEQLREKLAGKSKRQLIEEMIVRSPHAIATDKMVQALEVFPLWLLLLAHEHPTKIWLLDRDEKPSSAAILDDTARQKRWHSLQISIDECEGLTDLVDNYIALVVSWRTLLVMRHEFAHALTTFFSPETRARLKALYEHALAVDRFVEPLARESIGEYISCALSYYFFPDLRAELAATDEPLHALVTAMIEQAEELSAQLLAPANEGEPAAR